MFGRRGRAPATAPPPGSTVTTIAVPAVTPVLAGPITTAGIGGAAGWAPFPGYVSPDQQVGAYAGSMLNQYPAKIDGVQRHSGVEWLNPGWYTPTATPPPAQGNGVQPTQLNANIAGWQRYGSIYGGPVGPMTVAAQRERVVLAQVRASGASALNWARKLDPNYVGSDS